MKSQDCRISSNLVLLYRSFYADAFLIDVVPRYDIHGKKLFESNEKVYWDDWGLRNLQSEGGMDSYVEKVIENVVYKRLCHLGYKVYVGVLNAGEVDFVCTRPGETVYVQASYIVSEESTRIREFGPAHGDQTHLFLIFVLLLHLYKMSEKLKEFRTKPHCSKNCKDVI